MTYRDPALRPKRKSRTAWARAHLWDGCQHCDVNPGVLTARFERLQDAFQRSEFIFVKTPLLSSWAARSWLRQQGFDPSSPLGVADHIIPLWEGGAEDESNLQMLCAPCHRAKTAEEAKRRARAPKHRTPIAHYGDPACHYSGGTHESGKRKRPARCQSNPCRLSGRCVAFMLWAAGLAIALGHLPPGFRWIDPSEGGL